MLTVLTIFSHSWSGLVEGVMSLSPMDTTRVCGQYNSNLFWKGELLINLPYLCLSKKLWTCLPPMPNTANQRWKKSGTRELSSQKKFWFWTFRRKKFGVKKIKRKLKKKKKKEEKNKREMREKKNFLQKRMSLRQFASIFKEESLLKMKENF